MILIRLGFCVVMGTLWTTAVYGFETNKTAYALIVTNNRSLSLDRPDLHYADDDGIKYAQLFSEFLGDDNVTLLTLADAATLRLYPRWGSIAQIPSLTNLMREVAKLKKRIAFDRSNGLSVQLYLVFAGHGDLEHGQGFIELADGRLTAQKLENEVIAPLNADRMHLILDSCNSFFMLNPRGRGARRWAAAGDVQGNLLDKYPRLGALISTSSEAVTYEWSELQSGIFSYAVRSGLRGAADADGRAGLSYAELEAFIQASTAAIKNDLYRPKIFARGPGGNKNALFVPSLPNEKRVIVPGKGARRLTIRDGEGVRVLDVHKEDGTALALALPAAGQDLQVFETVHREGMSRPEILVRKLPLDSRDVRLDDGACEPMSFAMRGESPVFRSMFQQPYGKLAFAEFTKRSREQNDTVYGVNRQQMALLETHLSLAAKLERTAVIQSGVIGMSLGLIYSAVSTSMILNSKDDSESVEGRITLGIGVAAMIGHGIRLVRPTPLEKLHRAFIDRSNDGSSTREQTFVETELKWQRAAKKKAKERRIASIASIILGSTLSCAAAVYIPLVPRYEDDVDSRSEQYVFAGALGGVGLVMLGSGIWWWRHSAPIEEVYNLYQQNSARYRESRAAVSSVVIPVPVVFHNGGGIVLTGKF